MQNQPIDNGSVTTLYLTNIAAEALIHGRVSAEAGRDLPGVSSPRPLDLGLSLLGSLRPLRDRPQVVHTREVRPCQPRVTKVITNKTSLNRSAIYQEAQLFGASHLY